MAKNNAKLFDIDTLIAAGFDVTALLKRCGGRLSEGSSSLKSGLNALTRITDLQDAINRYKWYRLPKGLTSEIIERVLYYRGQGALFYIPETDTFLFLPYALDGNIDCYGRYMGVTMLPFNGSTDVDDDGNLKAVDKVSPWIKGLHRQPIYTPISADEKTNELLGSACVLLSDYTKQISQTTISRYILQTPLIEVESELLPFIRTALINGTGIGGMRVNSADESNNVEIASATAYDAAIRGKRWIAMEGMGEFQELGKNAPLPIENYLVSLQAIENYRLSMLGIKNGGLFQKKSHMLQDEQETADVNCDLIHQDGLRQRQEFCDVVNSIFGIDIWCESNETLLEQPEMDDESDIEGDDENNKQEDDDNVSNM